MANNKKETTFKIDERKFDILGRVRIMSGIRCKPASNCSCSYNCTVAEASAFALFFFL
jgi:hypothetical protein